MAQHQLIAAQLRVLAQRLPADAVDELADGLHQTYEDQLARRHDPDAAAQAAIVEFGDADRVTAAFFQASPWRRTALVLLGTGPVIGALWGATLVAAKVWTWPVPTPLKVLYGMALGAIVIALLTAVFERRAYNRTRLITAASAGGLIVLDALMLIVIVAIVPGLVWPMPLAVAASVIRSLTTLRAVRAVRIRS